MSELKTSGNRQRRFAGRASRSLVSIIMVPMLLWGCSGLNSGFQARDAFREANDQFNRGAYSAALGTYRQVIEKEPQAADRALFEMGIIHAHPGNGQKDYQAAYDSFQQLIRDYPESAYRKDGQLMLFSISTVIAKDSTIATQQAQIEALRHELLGRGNELATLQTTITALGLELKGKEDTIKALKAELLANPTGPADKVLIEKKARRLTLFAKGKQLKSYPIALGGNPDGPKERQGDNKTPEGIYRIESRNRNSSYHLALRISYPNERDKKRAQRLGVSPGGDIMIHGIKNGFSWVGGLHTELDWTKGCIAVTDQEIEEIEKLVPNGTTVEIRP